MKEINLTQGKVALVDDEDFEYLNQWRWYAHETKNTFYAARNIKTNNKQVRQLMHWDIMGEKWIDHIDRNGWNCQRLNMRKCTHHQNLMNRGPYKNTTSKYKGVSWSLPGKKWRSEIVINGKHIYIGLFINEIEAAKAYDKKAIEVFSEFAYLNFKT